MPQRRSLLQAAIALSLAPLAQAQSKPFPERPVRLIVPNPPAGPSDMLARYLTESMASSLGQPVVIDNRPGAAGLIGTAFVANASADGYTVLVTSRSNHVIAPLVQQSTQVQPQRDLVSVGLAIRAVGMFATHAKAAFKTLPEMLAYAKSHPGKLFYGSAGIGATNHIAIEQFKKISGLDITHVPYKGSGTLVTALMAGEIDLALLDFSSAQPGIKAGTIVPMVQTSSRRLSSLAQIPTFVELGYRDYDPSFWVGLSTPRGTPGTSIARLNAALNQALADTQMKARAQVNGWELVGGAPKVLDDAIASDLAQLPALLRTLDLKAN